MKYFSILIWSLILLHENCARLINPTKFRVVKNVDFSKISYKYAIQHFEVPLDHFSFSSNKSFNIRYLINDTWQAKENPPIFFYTGNEGVIEVFAENTGFIWDIAEEFGALIVFAEHRYYGESFPPGNRSFSDPEYAGYLNSYQALADYIKLIEFLKSGSKYRHSPVFAFGGSYGGMLSAWIRMKYPHMIQGAIASSAPILQFTGVTDCEVFARIVTSDFHAANPQCSKCISKSWTVINNVTSSDEGKKWISDKWKLCSPIKNGSDVQALKDWLSDIYSSLAMVNYPYPTNFLADLPGEPILVACKYLTNSTLSGKPLLTALFNAFSVYTNYTGKTKCNDFKGDSAVNLHADGWPYQACTEMVMPMCSDGVNDMFEVVPWDFKKYSDDCFAKFKVRPDPDLACRQYGCTDLSAATNIIFSNGLLDPWSGGGIMKNVSISALAVIIPEGAHHLDLRGHNPKDPYTVIQTRKFIRYILRSWISEYHSNM